MEPLASRIQDLTADILTGIVDGVIVIEAGGQVIIWNRAAQGMAGIAAAGAPAPAGSVPCNISQSVADAVPAPSRPPMQHDATQAFFNNLYDIAPPTFFIKGSSYCVYGLSNT